MPQTTKMMVCRVDVSKGARAYGRSPCEVTGSAEWSRSTRLLRAKLLLLFAVLLCTAAFRAATPSYDWFAWTHPSPAFDVHDVADNYAVIEPRDKCSGSSEQQNSLVDATLTTVGGWHDASRTNVAASLRSLATGGFLAWAAIARLVDATMTTVMTTRVFAGTLLSRLSSDGYFDGNGVVTPQNKTVTRM